jgi:hypothetical protein
MAFSILYVLAGGPYTTGHFFVSLHGFLSLCFGGMDMDGEWLVISLSLLCLLLWSVPCGIVNCVRFLCRLHYDKMRHGMETDMKLGKIAQFFCGII